MDRKTRLKISKEVEDLNNTVNQLAFTALIFTVGYAIYSFCIHLVDFLFLYSFMALFALCEFL